MATRKTMKPDPWWDNPENYPDDSPSWSWKEILTALLAVFLVFGVCSAVVFLVFS